MKLAFAPGSVSNVACGFDVFGFAVAGRGDRVAARRREAPGVAMAAILGDGGRLPLDPARNTAAVAATHLLAAAGGEAAREGVELTLEKGLPLASGLGSSAASAVAAVVAVDALLGLGAAREDLLAAAVAGEAVASGGFHADNVAPSLYGGFVLVRGRERPAVTPLPVPAGLACAVVRPHVEVETRAARAALGATVPLAAATEHWGNTAALVAGLFRDDLGLIASALVDRVAEPVRAAAVPGFREAQAAARAAGALGCSLSGSGPSIFALVDGLERAVAVAAAMADAIREATGIETDAFASPVDAPGACVVGGAEYCPEAG